MADDSASMTHDEITAALQAATQRDPREAPFGVFTSDPYPMGVGMTFWYESETERTAALLDMHPFVDGSDYDSDGRAAWQPAREELETLLAEAAAEPDLAERANKISHPHFCIHWIGTFEGLCTGNHDHERELREHSWLYADGEDPSDRPIGPDQVEAFIDCIREYGF